MSTIKCLLSVLQKLYIGDQCFTMRTADIGDTSQELYVRMLQANKAAAAPLKLQGNIVGRLTVERELGEQVEKNIRDLSHQLEKSKNERKIQILPEIPKDLAPTKVQVKSKKPTKVTKSTPAGHAPTDPNRSASTSLQPSRVASQRPSPRPSNTNADTAHSSGISESRLRLLHYAALRPRTTEDLISAMEGDIPVTRSEVEALITQVCSSSFVTTMSLTMRTSDTRKDTRSEKWHESGRWEVAAQDRVMARHPAVHLW